MATACDDVQNETSSKPFQIKTSLYVDANAKIITHGLNNILEVATCKLIRKNVSAAADRFGHSASPERKTLHVTTCETFRKMFHFTRMSFLSVSRARFS